MQSTASTSATANIRWRQQPNNDKAATEQPRVHIVDDDEGVRDAIGMLLDQLELPYESYPDAESFLEGNPTNPGDVAIMDIRMPGMSGLEAQRVLRSDAIRLPIVFITGHGDVPMAVQAMKNGATTFLRKPFREQELIDSVYTALEQAKAQRAEESQTSQMRQRESTLTPRERELFERIAAGQANKVVAIELGISERTVEIHRSNMMRKMGVRTLADLVRCRFLLEQQ